MATSSRILFIGEGLPTVSTSSLVIYDSGQAGELGAKRILTHPDSVNFPPIVYYRNPDRTWNLDNGVLPAPTAEAIRTLGGAQVVSFAGVLNEVIVTEIWEAAERSRASMPTSLFRQIYEYLRNPPAYTPLDQQFVTWAPRDRTDQVYNVQLFKVRVGNGQREQVFDVDDFRLSEGELAHPLNSLDVNPDGLLTRQVEVQMRIVSEVV